MPSTGAQPTSGATPGADADEGLSAPEKARQAKLQAIVIGLGILILLAFIGVIIGMVYRAGQIGKGAASTGSALPLGSKSIERGAPAPLSVVQFQPDIRLALPTGTVVQSGRIDGTRLLLQHDGPAGPGFIVVDLTTGQVVSRITIENIRGR